MGADPCHDLGGGFLHATAQGDRVGAGGHVAQTFVHHGLGQDGGGGGAVAGGVLGFGGHLLHQLGTEVLKGILEFDFLGDGDAVIDDVGSAELFLDHHVAALRPDRDLHRFRQRIDAPFERIARFIGKANQLGHWAEK